MRDLDRPVVVARGNVTEALELVADAGQGRAVRNRRDHLLLAEPCCVLDDLPHPDSEQRGCHVGVVPREHEHAGRARRTCGMRPHLGANESGGAVVWTYWTASSNCTMLSNPIHTSLISNAP